MIVEREMQTSVTGDPVLDQALIVIRQRGSASRMTAVHNQQPTVKMSIPVPSFVIKATECVPVQRANESDVLHLQTN